MRGRRVTTSALRRLGRLVRVTARNARLVADLRADQLTVSYRPLLGLSHRIFALQAADVEHLLAVLQAARQRWQAEEHKGS